MHDEMPGMPKFISIEGVDMQNDCPPAARQPHKADVYGLRVRVRGRAGSARGFRFRIVEPLPF